MIKKTCDSEQIGRREFLGTAAAVAGSAVLALYANSRINTGEDHPESRLASAYLPLYLQGKSYDEIASRLPGCTGIGRVYLAFGVPDKAGHGLAVEAVRPELKELIDSSHRGLDISLAVGGASVSKEAWSASARSNQFAGAVETHRKRLESYFGRKVHIDVDCEAPLKAPVLTKIVQDIRSKLPDGRDLTMAVPGAHNRSTYDLRAGRLLDCITSLRVMNYDYAGPWSDSAGPIAPGHWSLKNITYWVKQVGSCAIVEPGYPCYGYKFAGAPEFGTKFTSATPVHYGDIPPGKIVDDAKTLTSYYSAEGGVASCLSPAIIARINNLIDRRHPGIGGSFFWSMEGMAPEHLRAVGGT